jgi:hypothetical protein
MTLSHLRSERPRPAGRPNRRAVASLAIGAALAVGACTSTGATSAPSRAPSGAASSGPSVAASAAPSLDLGAHVDATIAGLEDALAKYRTGDAQGAQDAIAETYEEHFELVEDPLGAVDHDFMENLEELIAVRTRQVIQEGQPVTELEALVTEAKTLLTQAKDMLG